MKVAVVTGAGRGIGRAVAVELGRLGMKVVAASRSAAELAETVRLVDSAGGTGAAVVSDVRKKDDVARLLSAAEKQFGPIDVLVNAAGAGVTGPVVEFTDEDYDVILDTNLKAIFFACRGILPSMIERRTGQIINIASIAGKVGTANLAVYCASKFGLVGFAQALAEEVRQYGIRVSLICPGSTDTAFTGLPSKAAKARDRMLSPSDIAHAVKMLVEQAPNSFISEVIIRPTMKP